MGVPIVPCVRVRAEPGRRPFHRVFCGRRGGRPEGTEDLVSRGLGPPTDPVYTPRPTPYSLLVCWGAPGEEEYGGLSLLDKRVWVHLPHGETERLR